MAAKTMSAAKSPATRAATRLQATGVAMVMGTSTATVSSAAQHHLQLGNKQGLVHGLLQEEKEQLLLCLQPTPVWVQNKA
jgi:hypothetical protein